jgi:murein DD-endopeptidase MepM/ murein hydrolase activator NlpD
VRLDSTVEIRLDLNLPAPWFKAPSFGSKINSINGQSSRGWSFRSGSERAVLSVTEGQARATDTGHDSLGPKDENRAGRGAQVVVACGSLSLLYAHLKRGSTRSGTVRPGERIGYTGQTGHVADSNPATYVYFEVREGGNVRDPREYAEPLKIELQIGGKTIIRPETLPEGQVEFRGYDLGRWRPDPRQFRPGPCTLEVLVKRGSRVVCKQTQEIELTI